MVFLRGKVGPVGPPREQGQKLPARGLEGSGSARGRVRVRVRLGSRSAGHPAPSWPRLGPAGPLLRRTINQAGTETHGCSPRRDEPRAQGPEKASKGAEPVGATAASGPLSGPEAAASRVLRCAGFPRTASTAPFPGGSGPTGLPEADPDFRVDLVSPEPEGSGSHPAATPAGSLTRAQAARLPRLLCGKPRTDAQAREGEVRPRRGPHGDTWLLSSP